MSKKAKIICIIVVALAILLPIAHMISRTLTKTENPIEVFKVEEIQELFYRNPLNIGGVGDPFILKASDGKYYCYPTSTAINYLVWSSDDMINWIKEGAAYSQNENSWAVNDFWAPEVIEHNGKYYLYYSARWIENSSLRIGVAVADSPKGPFIDPYKRPMFDFGYAVIDAHVYIDDDGRKYLYYSRDCSENIVDGKHESHIYGVELNDDMISLKGEPVLLTKPEQPWELLSGGYVWNEGPYIVKRDDTYYLMYAANFYASKEYSVCYATSKSPLGPFIKYDNNPVLSYVEGGRKPKVSGPGHNSVTTSPDGTELFAFYHIHRDAAAGGGDRVESMDRMGFREDGSIYINGPTLAWQPKPSGVTGLANIAPAAAVKASSSKEGFAENALNDGEFTVNNRESARYEWVSSSDDKEKWVMLEWDATHKAKAIMIYPGVNVLKEAYCTIVFDNGKVIENVKIPRALDIPGEAAIVGFSEMDVKWIKILFDNTSESNSQVNVSEIVVLGQK